MVENWPGILETLKTNRSNWRKLGKTRDLGEEGRAQKNYAKEGLDFDFAKHALSYGLAVASKRIRSLLVTACHS